MIKTTYILKILIFLFFCSCSRYPKSTNSINKLKKSKKTGLWVELINEKDIQIATYKKGELNGKLVIIFKEGERAIYKYKKGKKNGKAVRFVPNSNFIYLIDWYKNDSLIKRVYRCPDF